MKYLGFKMVEAVPMTAGAANVICGRPKLDPLTTATVEGYLVTYDNEYKSWCPKAVFEETNNPIDALNFGMAIEAMKRGKKVARKGWNGKGMHLELQVPDENSKMTFPYPYFVIPDCEEGTRRIPYASTIVDILSNDWEIV